MQMPKAPSLLMWLLIAAMVLVFSSARRPPPPAGIPQPVGTPRSLTSEKTGARIAPAPSIDWMTVEDAAGKLQKEKRPILIDLYTTWCGWCRQMDKKTYSNKQVAQYLQEKFYTVKVDAETKATITWNGKTYHFSPEYRSNEFALYLTHGRLEFPTTIIIPPGAEPQAIPGYMEPKELELLVKYFGEGNFIKVSFDDYQRRFKATW
jgi:thioredoxin-related protein